VGSAVSSPDGVWGRGKFSAFEPQKMTSGGNNVFIDFHVEPLYC